MAKPRRKFSREYKLEAVRRVVNNGEPVTEVARAIGVQSQSLHGWVRAFKAEANEAFRGNGKLTAQDECKRRPKSDPLRRQIVGLIV
jgi:transposase